jgi:hypothetical protein
MRAAALLLLLLLGALSAAAAELIRFRTADGLVGLVDHPDKVPPGAEILERRPLPERQPAQPLAPAGRETPAEGAAPAPPPAAAEEAPAGPEPDTELCARFGLGRGCAAAEVTDARAWCARSGPARRALADAEEGLAAEEEAYERCRSVDGFYPTPHCSRADLERAETAVAEAVAAEEALEEACRTGGCLPGWIREGCERL